MRNKFTSYVLTLIVVIILSNSFLFPDATDDIKYFRLDKIISVSGEVTDIKKESCYDGENFKVIYMKESEQNRVYKVEIAPDWFNKPKVKKGDTIKVTGSYNQIENEHIIITQSLEFNGKIMEYRDKMGFPMWRGKGKMRGKGQFNWPRQRRGRH